MRFAPVVPPGAEGFLPTDLEAYFCFATEAAKNPHYAEFYRTKPNVVMDCPIYEGKQPLPPAELLGVTVLVKPRFVIIPDVRHDAWGTLKLFEQYYNALEGNVAATGVLQGNNYAEVSMCVAEYRYMGVTKFGVPKDLEKLLGMSRPKLMHKLNREGYFWDSYTGVHFLGGNWPYQSEHEASGMAYSMDTAEPWNAALEGMPISIAEPPSRPADWWTKLAPIDRKQFHSNIKWVQGVVNGAQSRLL